MLSTHTFSGYQALLDLIKGFDHRIPTGDAPPVYHLPYRKSPAELKAIEDELQRMLAMNIIRGSKSPWGSPVILVYKPPENGKPVPPRFVVDYRQLNSVTLTDGYPIPSVSNNLQIRPGMAPTPRIFVFAPITSTMDRCDLRPTVFTWFVGNHHK